MTAVRDCKIDPSEQDPIFQTLKSRFPKNLTQNERQFFQQDDVVHMWYCQEPVRQYNMEKLKQMCTPTARIEAVHPVGDKVSAVARAEDAGGLVAEVTLCVGSRVMFVDNAWQDVFLNNGSLGTVKVRNP